jgi:drug/metabolite transporter (DMT)-like permease
MLFVLLLYALFASVFTISKTGLMYTEPLFFVGIRMLFAGILLLAYQRVFKKESFKFDRKALRPLCL